MTDDSTMLKIIKTDSWKPEAQKEVRRLIASGWQLIEVVTDETSCHSSSNATPTIFFKLEKIS